MKKLRSMFLAVISILIVAPVSTFAITNNNGVEISDDDYEALTQMFSETYVMNISQERYEELQTKNLDSLQTETKYYEETYNPHLGLYTERELTEEEYENYEPTFDPNVSSPQATQSQSTSTSAKSLTLSITNAGTTYSVFLDVVWKTIPVTRSYDDIGIRYNGNFVISSGSQHGEQNYVSNGTYHTINYSWNGTNTKRFSNGYGTSMNLVNDSITWIECLTESSLYLPSGSHGTVAGSYQHATTNVSLATAQNYTLSGAGLGGVFAYANDTISHYYDGMSGLSISY